MNKSEALAHFVTGRALAEALGISQPSVSMWPEQIPELRQLQLEQITAGALRAGPECDKYRVAPLAEVP